MALGVCGCELLERYPGREYPDSGDGGGGQVDVEVGQGWVGNW